MKTAEYSFISNIKSRKWMFKFILGRNLIWTTVTINVRLSKKHFFMTDFNTSTLVSHIFEILHELRVILKFR